MDESIDEIQARALATQLFVLHLTKGLLAKGVFNEDDIKPLQSLGMAMTSQAGTADAGRELQSMVNRL